MSESYLEKCIQALPPEKQPIAREAFRAIAETGDDSLISKLLVTLEASSAYATTIPQMLTANGEHFLEELDARLHKASLAQASQEAAREERLKELLTKLVPQLGKSLAMDKVAAGLQAQTAEMGRVERSMVRLRQVRVGGLVLLMSLGVLLGAGAVVGIFWSGYHDAQDARHFVNRLDTAGIEVEIKRSGNGELLTITGPEALRGTDWRKDAKGYITGADIVFPIQEGR